MMKTESAASEARPSQFSMSTLLVATLGIGAFIAFPAGVSRAGPAWPLPVILCCWLVSLLVPGAIVAVVWRMRLPEVVAQLTLVTLLWNLATWPRVAAYRVGTILVVPVVMILSVLVLRRRGQRDDEGKSRTRTWVRVLGAAAWNSLLSFGVFLGIAYLMNHYGYVRTR